MSVHTLIVNFCMYVVGVRTAIHTLCVPGGYVCQNQQNNTKHPSTPVNVPALSKTLSKHPNRSFVNYLLTGLVQGFLAGLCWLPNITHVCKNLQSALKEPEIVDRKGYMIGPFFKSPFSIFRVSPLGIATRKYSPKKGLIINLSAPHDSSIPSINSLQNVSRCIMAPSIMPFR